MTQAEDDGDIRMADANDPGGRNGASATGTAAAASSACGAAAAASAFSFSSIFCGGESSSGGSARQVDEAVPKCAESDVSSSVSTSDQHKQRGEDGGGLGMMQCIDIGNAQDALSHARREARNVYATARGGNSSSPVPRQASSSARGKRKADIFRSRHSPILEAVAAAEAVEIEAKTSSRVGSPVPMGGFCSPDLHDIHEDGIDIMSRVGGGGPSRFPSILCFANPVHDSASEDEGNAAPEGDKVEGDVDVDGDGNVPEEARSTTSTQYFDNKKFNDIVESRPPMPLYHHQAIDPLLASDADQVTADDAPTKAAADHDNHKAANIHGRGCVPVESSSSSTSACDESVASAPKHDECAPGGVRTQEQHLSPTALSTKGGSNPAAPITPGTDGEDYGEASNKRQRKLGPSVPVLLGSAPVTPNKSIGVEV